MGKKSFKKDIFLSNNYLTKHTPVSDNKISAADRDFFYIYTIIKVFYVEIVTSPSKNFINKSVSKFWVFIIGRKANKRDGLGSVDALIVG